MDQITQISNLTQFKTYAVDNLTFGVTATHKQIAEDIMQHLDINIF